MPHKRITRVELEKFRGATTSTYIDFDSSKPIVVIFGENGSGKSTIGNAIDFICNRSIGSLENMSGADHKSIVSVGCNDTELKVVIHQNTNSWKGTKKGKNILVVPNTGHPRVEVLRRKRILQFIEAIPSERYNQIKGFLDFDRIQIAEDKLKEAASNAIKNLDRYAGLRAQAEGSLDQQWKSQGSPDGSAENWAQQKMQQDVNASRTMISLLQTAIASIENLNSAEAKLTDAKKESAEAISTLEQVKTEIEYAREAESQANVDLVDLLNKMKAVIADPYSVNECPACLSEYDLSKLRSDVDRRIDSLKSADVLNKKLDTANRTVENKNTLLEKAKGSFIDAIATCKSSFEEINKDNQVLLSQFPSLLAEFNTIVTDESKIKEFLANLNSVKSKLSSKEEDLSRDVTLYDTIRRQLELFQTNAEQVEIENNIKLRLEKTLDIVRPTRKAHTLAILDEVHDEAVRLWETIHPDESIKPTRFELKQETKGSLNQYASFGSVQDIAPQAYFSESHLDTLGFCYWLAITKYSTNGDAILVLDDVFTSVDNSHILRIMDLLNTEADNFNQIILTTHQRRWHDAYRYGTRSRNKAAVIELGQWNNTSGIVAYSTPLEIERFKGLIDSIPIDRQAICAKAGVLLEQMFEELTLHYRCRMPRGTRKDYTLGDYVSGSSKLFKKLKISKLLNDGSVEEKEFQQFYADLVEFVTVRNLLGAHFNFKSEDYTDTEALSLANMIYECISGLLCSDCSGVPFREDKTTGEWTCDCKKTRMYPKHYD